MVGWSVLEFSMNSTIKARIGWQGLTTAEYLKEGYAYLVTGTDFLNGKIYWEKCHYVNKNRYYQDSNIQLVNGDILITKDGTIGKVALVKSLDKKATLNSGIFVVRPKNELYDRTFMYHILNSHVFENFLSKLAAGSTINHLYQKDFIKFEFEAPENIIEQRAIASALSDADEYIASLENLIKKKRAIKQGAMQELLTGKRRLPGFEGEWVEKKIFEIGHTSSGGTPSRSVPAYYMGSIPWVTTSELNDNYINSTIEKISSEALNNSSAKLFPKGTVLMAMYGATIGRLGILNIEAATNQACCAMFFEKNIDEKFMYYLLLINRSKIIEQGSGAGQPNISQSIVKNLTFIIPKILDEQTAIANILSDMDKEIDSLIEKLSKARQIKQGMMSELLTGRIRLIEESAGNGQN